MSFQSHAFDDTILLDDDIQRAKTALHVFVSLVHAGLEISFDY